VVCTIIVSAPFVLAALVLTVNGGGALAVNHSIAPLHYVTIQGGQSLWQLAGDIAPHADPRDVVADIVNVNQLASSDLQAGQRIAIPARYEK